VLLARSDKIICGSACVLQVSRLKVSKNGQLRLRAGFAERRARAHQQFR